MKRVGFVGLGHMGFPMARSVADGGFDLAVFDADTETATHVADALSARRLTSAADFSDLDIVVTMLPTSAIVSNVLFDWDGGIVAAMKSSAIIVDMSSSDPVETVDSARRAAQAGIHLVDAPVSGGVAKAEASTLTIMLGGDDELAERVTPVLETMSSAIARTGPIGSAHAMKALNNVVAGATTIACFEALAAGGRFGLDPKTMVGIWNQSTAKSFVTSVVMEQNVITGTFDSGFALPLFAKDVSVAESIFASTGVEATVCESVAKAFRNALSELGNVDHTRVAELFNARATVAS